jgi:hypothetical protein
MGPVLLILTFALIAAVLAVAIRRALRTRQTRAVLARPGLSLANPISVRSFDEMDATLDMWSCTCTARPRVAGEGSREIDGRRYRVARLRCDACEEDWFIYFETTDLLQ